MDDLHKTLIQMAWENKAFRPLLLPLVHGQQVLEPESGMWKPVPRGEKATPLPPQVPSELMVRPLVQQPKVPPKPVQEIPKADGNWTNIRDMTINAPEAEKAVEQVGSLGRVLIAFTSALVRSMHGFVIPGVEPRTPFLNARPADVDLKRGLVYIPIELMDMETPRGTLKLTGEHHTWSLYVQCHPEHHFPKNVVKISGGREWTEFMVGECHEMLFNIYDGPETAVKEFLKRVHNQHISRHFEEWAADQARYPR